jgi:beta-glucosidase
MSDRIKQLLSELTLEEKAGLLTGASPWRTLNVDRLGLESMIVSDGPHGVRLSTEIDSMITKSHPATCFPVAAALAASWDTALLDEMGKALADEAIALGSDILLGPGMNIKRSPLCGRNFEYFSEDPVLAGEMAAALVAGMQSKGVGTSVKHFAVNNQETRRFSVNAVVDERTLHEIYLEGFRIAITKSKPWTVMCAYNSVNGDFCAENHYLLTEVLRDQWGYEGFVMSDWGAVHDRVEGVKAGLELEMPGPSPHRTQAVVDAVNNGELDMAVVDEAVRRLLNIILKAQETPKGNAQFDIDAHHALARKIAADCAVLLKNTDGLLPLSGDEHVAVIGSAATQSVYQGGGSSHINSTKVDNSIEFMKEHAEIQYAVGDDTVEVSQAKIAEAVAVAQGADVAVMFIALPASVESEGYDRPHMKLTDQQIALIKAVAAVNEKTVVVLSNGSAVDMSDWIDDVEAVVEMWLSGQAGAGAAVDVLYGVVNPSGKIAETFAHQLSDTPAYLNFPGERDEVRYGEGIYVGYRAYEHLGRDVLFPFGFGLSYTTFEYSNMQVSASEFGLNDRLTVTVDVTNTGDVAGKEIVQLYVRDVESRLPRPYKELKAFAKVALDAGETKQVTLELGDHAFMYYDAGYSQWLAEAGDFTLLVGSSSADIHLSADVTLTESSQLPSILHANSTIGDWLADPKGAVLIAPFLEKMQAVFGGENDAEALGADPADFFTDLPLGVMVGWSGETEQSPQDVVSAMLAQLQDS